MENTHHRVIIVDEGIQLCVMIPIEETRGMTYRDLLNEAFIRLGLDSERNETDRLFTYNKVEGGNLTGDGGYLDSFIE